AEAGAEPFGDTKDGERSYLQAFQWQTRYGDRRPSHSWNVVARMPGHGDPAQRKTVMITAHLDNLSADEKADYLRREGRDLSYYEGANDNTAAVAALLEVARAVRAAGGSYHDIVFMVPSAEEEGLKGTEAFMKSGLIPPEQIGAVVNLEMIGRNKTSELL